MRHRVFPFGDDARDDVAIGDDAYRLIRSIDHRDFAAVVRDHQLGHVVQRCLGCATGWISCHDIMSKLGYGALSFSSADD
jgi:hypothetical protein